MHVCAGVPLLGLVDWNPSGVAILCTYKYGNQRMGLEAGRWAALVEGQGGRRAQGKEGAVAGRSQP
jgi:meiotic recombination protein SPO11